MLSPTPKPLSPDKFRYKPVGTVFDDSIPIFIYEDVLEEIIDFSEQVTTREIGGFLIGGLHEDRRKYVEVRRFVPAIGTESRAASLTFTHESWSAARQEIEQKYPDDHIVGWHHTHPGFGIFLSGYDLFIHEHYFDQPWQIALVVDPQANEFGFFQWRHEKVVDCGFVCAYKEG
jgi:proteasome lid subunit RPN8/RPN11